MNVPVQKSIRLHGYDYSRNGAYFVTVCIKNKQHYFWDYTKYVGAMPTSSAMKMNMRHIDDTQKKIRQIGKTTICPVIFRNNHKKIYKGEKYHDQINT